MSYLLLGRAYPSFTWACTIKLDKLHRIKPTTAKKHPPLLRRPSRAPPPPPAAPPRSPKNAAGLPPSAHAPPAAGIAVGATAGAGAATGAAADKIADRSLSHVPIDDAEAGGGALIAVPAATATAGAAVGDAGPPPPPAPQPIRSTSALPDAAGSPFLDFFLLLVLLLAAVPDAFRDLLLRSLVLELVFFLCLCSFSFARSSPPPLPFAVSAVRRCARGIQQQQQQHRGQPNNTSGAD